MPEQSHCLECHAVIRGSLGVRPHEGLIRIGSVREGTITVYRCKYCGQYWEYRTDHFLPGWQTSFILYDYLMRDKDED